MKKIIYLVLFAFALMIAASSCKKDVSTPANVLTTKESNKKMLTAVSWKTSSRIVYDAPIALQDCEKDDIYTFSADGTFSLNVGSLICNGETNSSGTWIVNADGKGLLTIGSTTMTIVINSSSQLELTDANIDGITNQLTLIPK